MEQYFRNRARVDDEPDLARDRRANDARLKSRFEHIFEKYGKSFDGVADEIDLETGEIIVDNGHLEHMRHEVDPGRRVSSEVLRVLERDTRRESRGTANGKQPDYEDLPEGPEDDEGSGVSGPSGYSSSEITTDDEEDAAPRARSPDELSSDFHPPEDTVEIVQNNALSSRRHLHSTAQYDQSHHRGYAEPTHAAPRTGSPGNLLANLPFFRESAEAKQVNSVQPGSVGLDAIQALGQSIASQLARYMKGGSDGTSKRIKKKSSVQHSATQSQWQYPMLPGDQDPIRRPRNQSRTPSPQPPASSSAALFAESPGDRGSLWAPVNPQRKKRRHRSQLQNHTSVQPNDDDEIDILQSDPPERVARSTRDRTIEHGLCYNCGATESSSYRNGPDGVLCNACAIYYHRYDLMRPLEAPPTAAPQYNIDFAAEEDADEFAIPITPIQEAIPGYTANTGRRLTGYLRDQFTIAEEETIIKLREIDRLPFEAIARSLSDRSHSIVEHHYKNMIKRRNCETRNRLISRGLPIKPPPAVDTGASTHSRTIEPSPAAPPSRIQQSSRNSLGGGINRVIEDREPFTMQEDAAIVRLFEVQELTWHEISLHLPGRSATTLRNRYNRELAHKDRTFYLDYMHEDPPMETPDIAHNPELTRASQPEHPISDSGGSRSDPSDSSQDLGYTPEEDDLILVMIDDHGISFTEITRLLHGRTEASLQARYASLKRGSAHTTGVALLPPAMSKNAGLSRERQPQGSANNHQWIMPLSDSRLHTFTPSQHAQLPAAPFHTLHASTSAGYSYRGFAPDAEASNTQQLPETPHVPIARAAHPPRPATVGPSAWTATQPASKGPLPFQPARKGLVPIRPKPVAEPEVLNPFVHGTKPANPITQPREFSDSRELPPRRRIQQKGKARESLSSSRASPQILESASDEATTIISHTPETQIQDTLTATDETSASELEGEIPGPAFTHAQDRFIRKAREVDEYTWSEIAAQLPGHEIHEVHAIVDRYYNVIMGKARKAQAREPASNDSPSKHYKRYSEEEDQKIIQFKERGMSWDEMAKQLPGRDARSVTSHYYALCRSEGKPSRSRPDKVVEKQKRSSAPLLRQALDNSTRRVSNSFEAATLSKHSLRRLPRISYGVEEAFQNLTGQELNLQDVDMADDEDLESSMQRISPAASSSSSHSSSPSEVENGSSVDQEEDELTLPIDRAGSRWKDQGARQTASQEDEFAYPADLAMGEAVQVSHHQSPLASHRSIPTMGPDTPLQERQKAESLAPTAWVYLETEPHNEDDDYAYRSVSPDRSAVYDTPAKSGHESLPYYNLPASTSGTAPANYAGSSSGLDPFWSPPVPENWSHVDAAARPQVPPGASIHFGKETEKTHSNETAAASTGQNRQQPELVSHGGKKRKRGRLGRVVADSEDDYLVLDDAESETIEVASNTQSNKSRGWGGYRVGVRRKTADSVSWLEDEYQDAPVKRARGPNRRSTIDASSSAANTSIPPAFQPDNSVSLPDSPKRSPNRARQSKAGINSQTLVSVEINSGEMLSSVVPANATAQSDQSAQRFDETSEECVEVIISAITSSPSQSMTGREILDFIREKYPYYRKATTDKKWTCHIQNHLNRRPVFQRVNPEKLKRGGYWTVVKEKAHYWTKSKAVHDSKEHSAEKKQLQETNVGEETSLGTEQVQEVIVEKKNSAEAEQFTDMDVGREGFVAAEQLPEAAIDMAGSAAGEEPTEVDVREQSAEAEQATETDEEIRFEDEEDGEDELTNDFPIPPSPIPQVLPPATVNSNPSINGEQGDDIGYARRLPEQLARHKALRHSDSALVQRVAGTPARRTNLLSRSTTPRRFDALQRARDSPAPRFAAATPVRTTSSLKEGHYPIAQGGASVRRGVVARDAIGNDEGAEEIDELS